MEHIAHLTNKPRRSGYESTPDGAICGNGDLSVIFGNSDKGMRIFIAKCDLWYGVERYDTGGIRPLCYIDINIPYDCYRNYNVYQDMDNAVIRCNFQHGGKNVAFSVCVFKSENSVLIESVGSHSIKPRLCSFPERECDGTVGDYIIDGNKIIYRIFDNELTSYVTKGYAGFKQVDNNKYYLYASTNHDSETPEDDVINKLKITDNKRIEELKTLHGELWAEFWSKSKFRCSDKFLEKRWYASLYYLAVCAGNIKFPPGIYGNFITVEKVNWHGDYHLNYNYQAAFYAACSSNHTELTDCYHTPLEEFIPKGMSNAEKFGCRGILFPVAIQPKGLFSELDTENKYCFLRLFLGQKSNGIHPLNIMIFRWKTTRDLDYAREHCYPLVDLALEFFEDYCKIENGKFCINQDSIHEVPYYKKDFSEKKYKKYINDKNNILTLGNLRLCLEASIDMAKALNIDAEKQVSRKNMLDYLAPFPVYKRHGKKVFRYTEKGQAWNDSNDVGLQHIYPAGCIGLSSDYETLKIALDTFKMNNGWFDGNAVSSYYPMAARLGIDAKTIIKKLYKHSERSEMGNLLFNHGGGCLEYCSIYANTLNEMILQSHQGIIRIFPDWKKELDCRFENLRSFGAFLVSSSITDGEIGETTVICEKGGILTVKNPYQKCRILRNGNEENISSFGIIRIKTDINDIIKLIPVN